MQAPPLQEWRPTGTGRSVNCRTSSFVLYARGTGSPRSSDPTRSQSQRAEQYEQDDQTRETRAGADERDSGDSARGWGRLRPSRRAPSMSGCRRTFGPSHCSDRNVGEDFSSGLNRLISTNGRAWLSDGQALLAHSMLGSRAARSGSLRAGGDIHDVARRGRGDRDAVAGTRLASCRRQLGRESAASGEIDDTGLRLDDRRRGPNCPGKRKADE